MNDNDSPTSAELALKARLEQRAHLSIPVEVIRSWSDMDKRYAEQWADNVYLSQGYRISSAFRPPRCLERFLNKG